MKAVVGECVYMTWWSSLSNDMFRMAILRAWLVFEGSAGVVEDRQDTQSCERFKLIIVSKSITFRSVLLILWRTLVLSLARLVSSTGQTKLSAPVDRISFTSIVAEYRRGRLSNLDQNSCSSAGLYCPTPLNLLIHSNIAPMKSVELFEPKSSLPSLDCLQHAIYVVRQILQPPLPSAFPPSSINLLIPHIIPGILSLLLFTARV